MVPAKEKKAMKFRLSILSGALIALAMVTASFGMAQMGQGMGQGMRMGAYDASSVVTVKGTIQDVQEGTMQRGQKSNTGHMGTHLVLKTDKETLTVMVGPSAFLTEKNFSFAKDDQIEVTGSKVKYGDSDAIIAREIKKGDKVLTLRDEKGVPLWSTGRRR
jgi:DNA/RNA endonuclease YhcR with UshA esterase domain